MRVGIIQSSYVPWKGYFDFIASVDTFVFLEDVQYTRRDWRNRNIIKTSNGPRWLTVPVESKGKYEQRIADVQISDKNWHRDHLAAIRHAYAKAAHFKGEWPWLETLYSDSSSASDLSTVNRRLTEGIMQRLGITTDVRVSTEIASTSGKNERLLDICRALNATEYLSGPAAKSYLDEAAWDAAGVKVRFKSYAGYAEYPQLHGAFDHRVSIIDLILNTGPDATQFIRSTPVFEDEQT